MYTCGPVSTVNGPTEALNGAPLAGVSPIVCAPTWLVEGSSTHAIAPKMKLTPGVEPRMIPRSPVIPGEMASLLPEYGEVSDSPPLTGAIELVAHPECSSGLGGCDSDESALRP